MNRHPRIARRLLLLELLGKLGGLRPQLTASIGRLCPTSSNKSSGHLRSVYETAALLELVLHLLRYAE